MSGDGGSMTDAACARCAHFEDDPAALERAIEGLTSLSSGHGATRARDGLCTLHDRLTGAHGACGDYRAAQRD